MSSTFEYIEITAWEHEHTLVKQLNDLGSVGWSVVTVQRSPSLPSHGGAVVISALLTREQATTLAAPTTPNPAWLPDPTGRHTQRWWDGLRWTEHVIKADSERAVDYLAQRD